MVRDKKGEGNKTLYKGFGIMASAHKVGNSSTD